MKNLLLFSAFLLTSIGALAQLSVKPTGTVAGTESFVFVKDQILFVTKDVTLTKNPAGDKVASIYLRDNGQLIQAEAISTNTGNGLLSVYQDAPDDDAFDYRYWCSPVGRPHIPGSTGNDNAGLSRIYETVPLSLTAAVLSGNDGYVNGFTDPKLTISTRWTYIHPLPGTEAESDYTRVRQYDQIPPGFGFLMKGVNEGTVGAEANNHQQIYDFRGRPNSGDFPIPMAAPVLDPVSGDLISQMTLSGNPYPSALDLNKLFYDSGNEELASFRYYDEDRDVDSHNYTDKPFGYGTWVPEFKEDDNDPNNGPFGIYTAATFYIWKADGTTTGSGTTSANNDQNKRFAPIGQGIMFVGSNLDTDGDDFVTIRNSQRVFRKEGPSNNSVFQRPEGDASLSEAGNSNSSNNNLATSISAATDPGIDYYDYRTPQTRLYIVFDGAMTRDLVLAFSDQATEGYDRGMDGPSPLGMKSDAYFPITTGSNTSSLPVVINTLNFDSKKSIPLTIKVDKQMKVEIKVVDEVKKPYQNAYFYDSQEDTFQKLSKVTPDAAGVGIYLPKGEYKNRFYIVFRGPAQKRKDLESTIVTKTILDNVSFFQNNPAGILEVKNPEGYSIKTANVYDMGGKLVLSQSNIGDSRNFSFNTSNLSDGVYLVKLLTSDNVSIDYKSIVHNK